jgi:hypothetical protein
MWLLDANLDIHLAELLRHLQIDCDTAENRLSNGELVAAAVGAGFSTLLTRDRLFAESASRAWRDFPSLSVVIVTLPQLPSGRYLASFEALWRASPIQPPPGKIISWP